MLSGLLNRKSNKIQFATTKGNLTKYPHPTVAYKNLPKWFRKLKPSEPNKPLNQSTAKRCIPLLDAMSQGYIIPAWEDIYVNVSYVDEGKSKEKSLTIAFPSEHIEYADGRMVGPLDTHPWEQVGDGCDAGRFELGKAIGKLISPWVIKTPKGWSCYFKSPANNFSNDLRLFEGVVDTDNYFSPVNFPFFWSGNEVGEFLIPKGSPLVQVIPFKRETLSCSVGEDTFDFPTNIDDLAKTLLFDKYKRLFWHKRDKYNK